jgi:hypothetical protein
VRDLLIRLPRTATRPKAPSWATLLERVEPRADWDSDFHGTFMTPGKTIEEHELWPTANYPAIPVLLERCQVCFEGRGHNRNPMEYILWIYQVRKREWRQVAHVSAHHPEDWIPVIRNVALRLVKPAVNPPEPDLHTAARRIAAVVESELLSLYDNRQRSHLLELSHNYLGQRAADLGESKKFYQIPLRPDDYFEELLVPTSPDHIGWTVSERDEAAAIPFRRFF